MHVIYSTNMIRPRDVTWRGVMAAYTTTGNSKYCVIFFLLTSVLPILNLLFMTTHLISLHFSCFPTLFSWYEIWLVISWNVNYVPDMRKKQRVRNKRHALVNIRKHMGTTPPIFGGFCLLGLVHSWLYLQTLIKGKVHSVEQLL
jgi:hypothetical protein